ncbi:LamB/YcsF family protein [Microbacterium sp. NPDC055910]|uniref:LamB/YcsF family protein n=1 Tax=Microbacterium sp. NPDC055910 TaxID=3345659 RepID=UPI0035D6BA57
MVAIDLNADLGETIDGVPTADDEAMFALISSANIACGGHAGDAASLRAAVERSARYGVAVGAHPSYPDRAGFGRTRIAINPGDLADAIARQLDALVSAGADVRYVKPHGALYHSVSRDPVEAALVVDAVADLSARLGRGIPILGLDGEIAFNAEQRGIPFVREAFLDRGYRATGGLVARGAPGDVLHDPAEIADRAVRLAVEGVLVAVDGGLVRPDAASLCVHGDSPGAVAIARRVRAALDAEGVEVRSPW